MTKNNEIDRRSVLQKVGIAGIAGIYTASNVSAENRNENRTTLSEYGLQYDLIDFDSVNNSIKTSAVDAPLDYQINNDTIRIRKGANGTLINALDRTNEIIKTQTPQLIPNSDKRIEVRSIPIRLSKRKQPTKVAHLVNSTEVPSCDVQYNGRSANVRLPQKENIVSVEPGEDKVIDMNEQTVQVRFEKLSDEFKDMAGARDHQRPLKKEQWTEDIGVIPKLKIKNHGTMKVADLHGSLNSSSDNSN